MSRNMCKIRVCRDIDKLKKLCLSRQIFVPAERLSQQKNMFVATKVYKKTCYGETNTYLLRQTRVSRDKAVIATKMILMAAPASDSEGVNFR